MNSHKNTEQLNLNSYKMVNNVKTHLKSKKPILIVKRLKMRQHCRAHTLKIVCTLKLIYRTSPPILKHFVLADVSLRLHPPRPPDPLFLWGAGPAVGGAMGGSQCLLQRVMCQWRNPCNKLIISLSLVNISWRSHPFFILDNFEQYTDVFRSFYNTQLL